MEGLGDVGADADGDDDGDEEDFDVFCPVGVFLVGEGAFAGAVEGVGEFFELLGVAVADGEFEFAMELLDFVEAFLWEDVAFVMEETGDAFVE